MAVAGRPGLRQRTWVVLLSVGRYWRPERAPAHSQHTTAGWRGRWLRGQRSPRGLALDARPASEDGRRLLDRDDRLFFPGPRLLAPDTRPVPHQGHAGQYDEH